MIQMSKQVQIDEELFAALCVYFLQDPDELDFDDIAAALSDKLDKMVARALYTEYKTAANRSEREAARNRYLDHVGISHKFRSKSECRP